MNVGLENNCQYHGTNSLHLVKYVTLHLLSGANGASIPRTHTATDMKMNSSAVSLSFIG